MFPIYPSYFPIIFPVYPIHISWYWYIGIFVNSPSSIFPVYPIYQYQLNFWENSYPDIYLQSYLPTYQYISQYQYISIHYPIVSIVYPNKSSISSVYPIFPNVHSLWVTAVKKGYQFHALGESGASPGRCPGGILHGHFLGIWDGFQINLPSGNLT